VTDEAEEARREEAEARDRLREAEGEARETLEEAEELERDSVAEAAEAVTEEERVDEPGEGERQD
jgi:hypothetical protein